MGDSDEGSAVWSTQWGKASAYNSVLALSRGEAGVKAEQPS